MRLFGSLKEVVSIKINKIFKNFYEKFFIFCMEIMLAEPASCQNQLIFGLSL